MPYGGCGQCALSVRPTEIAGSGAAADRQRKGHERKWGQAQATNPCSLRCRNFVSPPIPFWRRRYSVQTGGLYGEDSVDPPFVAGHDGVAVVAKASRAAAEPEGRVHARVQRG